MNHEGEIRALVKQVRPHVAAITTIAPAHLEYFGTLEAIADAKAEIFEGIEPGGTAVLPRDNPQYERLLTRAKACDVANIRSFGSARDADARLVSIRSERERQIVSADLAGEKIEFTIGALGSHIASNALAVLLVAKALGVGAAKAAAALSRFSSLKGRGARVALGDIALIDESYNANPASMTAALNLLKASEPESGGRRIAVLGDMLELGHDAPALHRAIVKDIAASGTDLVFLCGTQMRALWEALPASQRGAYAATSAELSAPFLAALKGGDVVLVKGSFGSRMSVIVEALKMRGAAAA
jgi:UDP-N-acetylmuramoyl-tripeptide--D-alanyl-D-alanine ligase